MVIVWSIDIIDRISSFGRDHVAASRDKHRKEKQQKAEKTAKTLRSPSLDEPRLSVSWEDNYDAGKLIVSVICWQGRVCCCS